MGKGRGKGRKRKRWIFEEGRELRQNGRETERICFVLSERVWLGQVHFWERGETGFDCVKGLEYDGIEGNFQIFMVRICRS